MYSCSHALCALCDGPDTDLMHANMSLSDLLEAEQALRIEYIK